jgi:transketolase
MMPNTMIAAPGDPMEVRACLRYLVANPQPSYLRLGKAGEPCFHDQVPEVKPGSWLQIKSGNGSSTEKLAILTTGAALTASMEWSEDPELQGVAVCSLPLWGMRTKAGQGSEASRFQKIVTVEDHLSDGGFGSWLREALADDESFEGRLRTLGLDSAVCGMVGSQTMLNRLGGLDVEGIKRAFGRARS